MNAEQLPRMPLSLMLQFKRPEYLTTANASQWKLWSNPYYRFVRAAEQHRVLRRLDRSLAGDVTVRYAAPAFHLLSDLEAAQLAGEVIARSGHVSPEELGSHKVWTYQVSGTTGQGNPDGAELPFSTLQQLFVRQPAVAETVGQVSVYEGLERHLDTVAVVCRERNPALRGVIDRWQQSLARSNLGLDRRAALINYATIQTFCSWQRISWWLLDGLEVRPAG
ncbi:hypothetical protein [Streptomyces sp. SID13031]|uniref:hypothetical protein n=1 Tax=Streptomyces sp. SID13031 TaxID=2706046 RepID=UPI0013C93208|nr:hypothetical protein [Streptomyces sp. SID13031]NEA36864.1 hypothetical protein [Streptomyces sp. SID13031]